MHIRQVKYVEAPERGNPVSLFVDTNLLNIILVQHQVRIHDLQDPLIRFAVAVEGASWTDPDSIALMVMQSMLGSWNKNAGGGKHVGLVFFPCTSYGSL